MLILLVPRYSQLTLAALVEPLRMANTVANRQLYHWRLCSEDGDPVTSSSGFTLAVDEDIAGNSNFDTLFALASYDVTQFATARINAFLKRSARSGAIVGGLDAAPYLLASAGLLDGHRATTHWDELEDFRVRYPRIDVVPERYVIDRQRITTSGSLPSFDLVLEFIRRRNGLMLAMNVSGNFLYDQARPGSESQYMIAASLINARHPMISRVVHLMERNLRSPLGISQLAAAVGLSERSLLRRFRATLGIGPRQYYRALRLDAGRRLLDNSDLSVTEIAIACGFDSRGSFTRAFRQVFGIPPSAQRPAGRFDRR
ncbi:MAG: GlxA family transcriptional regulator [Gammaproteobacteria bacterium]|nr:GlxA family transcriptional regulator [Gammaproteobacteria bacterium]